MPRVKRKGDQSSDARQLAIKDAVAAVQRGESIRSAAQRFDITKSTLHAHYSKLNKARGGRISIDKHKK